MKKTILITGTSTGVGFESAILFAQNNFKVYATMRNLQKADALRQKIEEEQLDIEILQLDVTDYESITAAVKTILASGNKIDVLCSLKESHFPGLILSSLYLATYRRHEYLSVECCVLCREKMQGLAIWGLMYQVVFS